MIYKEELTERNKIIVDYLGGESYVGVEYQTQHDSFDSITIKGDFINEWRDKQKFVVGGFDDKMMMSMLKFHSDWNWLHWLYSYLETKGYYGHIDPWSITFIEYISGDELEILCYEFYEDVKLENYYNAITDLIKNIK